MGRSPSGTQRRLAELRGADREDRELSLTPAQLQSTTQIYFSLYFTMTGLHALHMIIGIGLMIVITWMAWKGKFDAQYYTPVEMSGLYWHFVDIVWIFLFPLLYLVERSLIVMSGHVSPVSLYITIFLALMVLTGVTVARRSSTSASSTSRSRW